MIGVLGLVLAGAILSGCVVGVAPTKLTRLDDVSSREAITVAKFSITYNGKDVTKGCNLIFSNKSYHGCTLDESGYVFMKLPIGTHAIRYVVHKNGLMQRNFRSDELTCLISGEGTINYIGDISLDWHGVTGAESVGVIAGIGLTGYAFTTTHGKVVVAVASDTAAAQAAFKQKFPTDRIITPSLLVVQPHQQ